MAAAIHARRIGIIDCGLIGRGWAIVFAHAGYQTLLLIAHSANSVLSNVGRRAGAAAVYERRRDQALRRPHGGGRPPPAGPKDQVAARQAWRDRRLMALLKHIAASHREFGR